MSELSREINSDIEKRVDKVVSGWVVSDEDDYMTIECTSSGCVFQFHHLEIDRLSRDEIAEGIPRTQSAINICRMQLAYRLKQVTTEQ